MGGFPCFSVLKKQGKQGHQGCSLPSGENTKENDQKHEVLCSPGAPAEARR